MSRSGYSDDGDDQWGLIRWRGAVRSAMRGKRGQAFARELIAALDALPEKRLIAHDLIKDGEVCAIGAVGLARGDDMSDLNPDFSEGVADHFGIARALVCEIEHINDDDFSYETHYYQDKEGIYHRRDETPEKRFIRVRAWAEQWSAPLP